MHDHVFGAFAGFEGAADQVFACLDEYLDGDVVGDAVAFNDFAYKVEIGLGGGGEADFDLFVAHFDQQVEHASFAFGRHRVDQCLVAVAQVNGAPLGCVGDFFVGPGAVGQADVFDFLGEGLVAVDGHGGVALFVPCGLAGCAVAGWGGDFCGGGEEGVVCHGAFLFFGAAGCAAVWKCCGVLPASESVRGGPAVNLGVRRGA